MRDTILIAPDKFKGTFSAEEVEDIIAEELSAITPMRVIKIPMADGGEGTPHILNGSPVIVSHDFIGPQCYPGVGILDRSSFALGEAIIKTMKSSTRFYVGIGGTATVDGGAGTLQALGARFYDKKGQLITDPVTPRHLLEISRVDTDAVKGILTEQATLLCDVRASLIDSSLSSLDFARQKGATDEDIPLIAKALSKLSEKLCLDKTTSFEGAGGGLPFSLGGVMGAKAVSGAETILSSKEIDWDRIALVITGEGSYDHQTQGGKVAATLCREAMERDIRAVVVAGYADEESLSADKSKPCVIRCISEKGMFDSQKAELRLRAAIRKHLLQLIGNLSRFIGNFPE